MKVQVVKRGKQYRVMKKHQFWCWTYVKVLDKIAENIPGVGTHYDTFQTECYRCARNYAEKYAGRNFAHFIKEIRDV